MCLEVAARNFLTSVCLEVAARNFLTHSLPLKDVLAAASGQAEEVKQERRSAGQRARRQMSHEGVDCPPGRAWQAGAWQGWALVSLSCTVVFLALLMAKTNGSRVRSALSHCPTHRLVCCCSARPRPDSRGPEWKLTPHSSGDLRLSSKQKGQ